MKNEKGTTLIEIIIVISIMTIVASIVFLSYTGSQQIVSLEQFKDQLQRDINWALQYADLHQQVVYITFLNDHHAYIVQVLNQTKIKRTYSEKFRVTDNLFSHRLTILANGTVSNFGNLKIYIRNTLFATLYIEMTTGVVREEVH